MGNLVLVTSAISASRLHGAEFSATMSFLHNTHKGAGGITEICNIPWCGRCRGIESLVALSKRTSTFGDRTKHHTTGQNTCHTSPFGHVKRAMPMMSLSLRYERLQLYLACRTHRPLENPVYSRGRERAQSSLVEFSIGRRPKLSTRTTKKHKKKIIAAIREDADHIRRFHCCHVTGRQALSAQLSRVRPV